MAVGRCLIRLKNLRSRAPAIIPFCSCASPVYEPAPLASLVLHVHDLLSQVALKGHQHPPWSATVAASYSSEVELPKPYKGKSWNPEVKAARRPSTVLHKGDKSWNPEAKVAKRAPSACHNGGELPTSGSGLKTDNRSSENEGITTELVELRGRGDNAGVSCRLNSKKGCCQFGSGEERQHVYGSSDFCDHRGMQVVFLGTSSSMPTLSRNTSCIALRLDGTIYLFDCGEGVQRQLHRTPFRQRNIDSIFITHMHGDHIFGLPGMTASPSKQPIEIFGPEGLRQWIRTTLRLSCARVPTKYAVHQLVLNEERTWKRAAKWNLAEEEHEDELPGKDISCSKDGLWHVHKDDKYVVVAGLLKHTIPSWGYVVQEHTRPGRFSVERALEAGVRPGPMYASLQKGHTVSLSNGNLVKPEDVLGPPRRGRKVVILGDTCDSRSLQVAAKGADVVVHEATVVEHEASLAKDRGHSTATMAGKFARSIDASTLVLTHFSGKLEGALYGHSEGSGTIEDLVTAARKAFAKHSVVAAHDLAAYTVLQQDGSASSFEQT